MHLIHSLGLDRVPLCRPVGLHREVVEPGPGQGANMGGQYGDQPPV